MNKIDKIFSISSGVAKSKVASCIFSTKAWISNWLTASNRVVSVISRVIPSETSISLNKKFIKNSSSSDKSSKFTFESSNLSVSSLNTLFNNSFNVVSSKVFNWVDATVSINSLNWLSLDSIISSKLVKTFCVNSSVTFSTIVGTTVVSINSWTSWIIFFCNSSLSVVSPIFKLLEASTITSSTKLLSEICSLSVSTISFSERDCNSSFGKGSIYSLRTSSEISESEISSGATSWETFDIPLVDNASAAAISDVLDSSTICSIAFANKVFVASSFGWVGDNIVRAESFTSESVTATITVCSSISSLLWTNDEVSSIISSLLWIKFEPSSIFSKDFSVGDTDTVSTSFVVILLDSDSNSETGPVVVADTDSVSIATSDTGLVLLSGIAIFPVEEKVLKDSVWELSVLYNSTHHSSVVPSTS